MRASNCSCSWVILTSKLARAIIHLSRNLTTTTLFLPQSRPARRFASDPVTAKPAGEGIDRRPRIRRRVALPTAARRVPGRAVRLVNGRGCDVMAAVAAKDHAPVWLSDRRALRLRQLRLLRQLLGLLAVCRNCRNCQSRNTMRMGYPITKRHGRRQVISG